jgi:hypothetical protein
MTDKTYNMLFLRTGNSALAILVEAGLQTICYAPGGA